MDEWLKHSFTILAYLGPTAVPFLKGCPSLDECAIFGGICHFWMNLIFYDECVIFGGMCHFWMNGTFLDEWDIFGGMCRFWMNVPFLDECDIFE